MCVSSFQWGELPLLVYLLLQQGSICWKTPLLLWQYSGKVMVTFGRELPSIFKPCIESKVVAQLLSNVLCFLWHIFMFPRNNWSKIDYKAAYFWFGHKICTKKNLVWVLRQHAADGALVRVTGAFTFSFPFPLLPSLVKAHFAYS